ncbi:hypothetical protein [Vibrio campbellii]|uniref:hypothetical protein n=1 Tax=Vibrio campbellii TaxID=680 RepID=UPI0037364609
MKKTLGLTPATLLIGLLLVAWIFLTGNSFIGFFGVLLFIIGCAVLFRAYMNKVDPDSSVFIRSKVEDIRNEGRCAFLAGEAKEANPYTGIDGELWDDGYDSAIKQKEPAKKG